MLLLDLLADIVKTQFMIDILQEQITAIVAALLVFLNKSCWRVLNNDFFISLFFCSS
jgi:hypothetical protein